jgi:hypothetical protein
MIYAFPGHQILNACTRLHEISNHGLCEPLKCLIHKYLPQSTCVYMCIASYFSLDNCSVNTSCCNEFTISSRNNRWAGWFLCGPWGLSYSVCRESKAGEQMHSELLVIAVGGRTAMRSLPLFLSHKFLVSGRMWQIQTRKHLPSPLSYNGFPVLFVTALDK